MVSKQRNQNSSGQRQKIDNYITLDFYLHPMSIVWIYVKEFIHTSIVFKKIILSYIFCAFCYGHWFGQMQFCRKY